MTDLTGKVAVVTGSARGIGKAIAQRFAGLGANVVVNYSGDAENAARTVAEIEAGGARAIAVQGDVSSTADLDRLFQTAIDTFGRVDIVVANAGVEVVGMPIVDVTEEQFDRSFAINSKGTFFTLAKGAKVVEDGGRLLYIASTTAIGCHPTAGLYGSSKVAGLQTVGVLAQEIGARNITVNSIIPSSVAGAGIFTGATPGDAIHQMNSIRPLGGRLGTPKDVADAAEYFVSDLADWVSGTSLLVAGGLQQ
ncbi:SDR family oxidoreductase [Microbacterium sp. LWS13-1.2]|uniref:SDR family oxidoreductase n=1 Tax=Microbacterium sp. LWS13-1.2 TaxID=3135264 RepID=A0AAU6SBP7_9MICO